MREALEHMANKNEDLADDLAETQNLLKLHKKLLDEALADQAAAVGQCAATGSQLLGKCDE